MPIQETIRNIEIQKECLIIHLVSGKDLRISYEPIILTNVTSVYGAVVRYDGKIIWTSTDKKP